MTVNATAGLFYKMVIYQYVVPLVGFELTTNRLQGGCSTTELKRRTHRVDMHKNYYICNNNFRLRCILLDNMESLGSGKILLERKRKRRIFEHRTAAYT